MRKLFLLLLLVSSTIVYSATDTTFVAIVISADQISKKTVRLTLIKQNEDTVYLFTRSMKEYPLGTIVRITYDKNKPRKNIIDSKESISAKIEIIRKN